MHYINKCSLFSTLREPSVHKKDLRALTLVGTTRDNPVLILLVEKIKAMIATLPKGLDKLLWERLSKRGKSQKGTG